MPVEFVAGDCSAGRIRDAKMSLPSNPLLQKNATLLYGFDPELGKVNSEPKHQDRKLPSGHPPPLIQHIEELAHQFVVPKSTTSLFVHGERGLIVR